MEWMMSVNEILKDKVSKLNYTLIPPGFHGDAQSVRLIQQSMSKMIDELGKESASAQELDRVITTAEKLCNAQDHTLYLLKDAKAKWGKGALIGMLKVGPKHLFLFDEQEKVREVTPLCVLDFYIARDRQRHGYGKFLFDYMLQDVGVAPHELAVDCPSPKMEMFLIKNYGLTSLKRQSNNFAVSPEFFANVREDKSGRSTPVVPQAVGRFVASRRKSSIANIIHGGTSYTEPSNGLCRSRAKNWY